MATQSWFAFRAYNSEALYGYGTTAEAEEYVEILNADREINVYGVYPLTAAEAEAERLEERSDAMSLDDELAARKGLR